MLRNEAGEAASGSGSLAGAPKVRNDKEDGPPGAAAVAEVEVVNPPTTPGWPCCACPGPAAGGAKDASGPRGRRLSVTSHVSVTQVSQTFQYPMWGLPMDDFLALPSPLASHQELRDAGRLRTYEPGMLMLFLSHEWLGYSHIDPEGTQVPVMQHVFRRLMSGTIAVEPYFFTKLVTKPQHLPRTITAETWKELLPQTYVWLDWISMPQKVAYGHESDSDVDVNLCAAVESIPAYVQVAHFFVVMAPSGFHVDRQEVCDYATWLARGWCIMELQARVLSPLAADISTAIVVVRGADATPFLVHPWRALSAVAGVGNFSCCARGHFVNGQAIPCDKTRVLRNLTALITNKVQFLMLKGCIMEARLFRALHPQLLEGLPSEREAAASPPRGQAVAHFLAEFGFADVHADAGDNGWGPLRLATIARDAAVVQRLLEQHADVESPLAKSSVQFTRFARMTVLHESMYSSTPLIVHLLLQAGANPRALAGSEGYDALMFACMGRRAENVVFWLDRFQGWDVNRCTSGLLGMTALNLAFIGCTNASQGIVERLLAKMANVAHVTNIGVPTLILACASETQLPGVARALLDRRADIHATNGTPQDLRLRAFRQLVKLQSQFCGPPPGMLRRFVSNSSGATALHSAAMFGLAPVISVLLEARADPRRKNDLGKMPFELAREFGPYPTACALLRDDQADNIEVAAT